MVFFICNACGQSVKKAQVEKHYLQQCRQCEVLSCMDCGQDFHGDGYKEHTKCISENEKYGSKTEVSNMKPNKGDVKQAAWLERVREASSCRNTNPKMRSLLNQITEYPNIPRKKTKFENFLKNSLRVYDKHLMQQAWLIVSGTDEKNSAEDTNKKSAEKCDEQANSVVTVETNITTVQESRLESNGKLGRKRKKSEECGSNSKQVCSKLSNPENNEQTTDNFKWNKTIKSILRERESHEMSIKKLRKKVIAEYISNKGENQNKTKEELNDKFYKKLNSNPSVKIADKRVQLIVPVD